MGAQGICFSVASNTALLVLTQILQHGRVRRAAIGIQGQQTAIPRHIARHAEVDQPSGIRVMEVQSASPAERAGMRSGDLIIAISAVADLRGSAAQRRSPILLRRSAGTAGWVIVKPRHHRAGSGGAKPP